MSTRNESELYSNSAVCINIPEDFFFKQNEDKKLRGAFVIEIHIFYCPWKNPWLCSAVRVETVGRSSCLKAESVEQVRNKVTELPCVMYVYFSDMSPASFQLLLTRVTGEKVSTVKHSCPAQSSLRRLLFRRRGRKREEMRERGLLNTFTGVCFFTARKYAIDRVCFSNLISKDDLIEVFD